MNRLRIEVNRIYHQGSQPSDDHCGSDVEVLIYEGTNLIFKRRGVDAEIVLDRAFCTKVEDRR